MSTTLKIPLRLEGDWGVLIVEGLFALDILEEQVSSTEWQYAQDRFKSQSRRCEWLSARAIVRRELIRRGFAVRSGFADMALVESLYSGAPVINPELNSGLHISISHTTDCVAVLFSQRRCGVDIECSDRVVNHLISRFATDTEMLLVENCAVSAIALWCAKECLYKLAGCEEVSLREDLTVCSITACREIEGYSVECSVLSKYRYSMTLLSFGGHIIAIC